MTKKVILLEIFNRIKEFNQYNDLNDHTVDQGQTDTFPVIILNAF